MSKNKESMFETEYVSVSDVMKIYKLSRPTVIRWIKNKDSNVRYFQDSTYIRVNLQDFRDLVELKVQKSMEKDRNRTSE